MTGPPTKLEYFLLEAILSYCSENELESSSDIISSIYNTHFLTASDQGLKLSPKSLSDIAKYLLHRRKSLATSYFRTTVYNAIEMHTARGTS